MTREEFMEQCFQNLEKGEAARERSAKIKEREAALRKKMLAEARRLMKEGRLHERTITVRGRQFWLHKAEGDVRHDVKDEGVEIHFALVPADGDLLACSDEEVWGLHQKGLDEVFYPMLSLYVWCSTDKHHGKAGEVAVEFADKPFAFASAEDAATVIEAARFAIKSPPRHIGEAWNERDVQTLTDLKPEYFFKK